jgi:hypothetical protein
VNRLLREIQASLLAMSPEDRANCQQGLRQFVAGALIVATRLKITKTACFMAFGELGIKVQSGVTFPKFIADLRRQAKGIGAEVSTLFETAA